MEHSGFLVFLLPSFFAFFALVVHSSLFFVITHISMFSRDYLLGR
jgi:hypothetical protein